MDRNELKREADTMIEALPENATWDDLMCSIYVRQKIERGEADKKANDVLSTSVIEAYFAP